MNGGQADSRDVVAVTVNLRHEYRVGAVADRPRRVNVHASTLNMRAVVQKKLAIIETLIGHAGNIGKARAASIGACQRAVLNFRILARRRRNAFGDPQIQRDHQRAQDIAGGKRIDALLRIFFYGFRAEGAVVLRAGDDVNTNLVRDNEIVAFPVHVRQAAALLPILRRGLRVKYIRVGLRALEDAVAPAGLRISDNVIGVGKKLGIELIRMLL
ncbi:MAG: hypothetical protein HYU31_07425 [Deltaproteobacteria bacterium]|nr:hypothetical protein [Deltaproteobacteria bacterium]